jgi:hypothetical protein
MTFSLSNEGEKATRKSQKRFSNTSWREFLSITGVVVGILPIPPFLGSDQFNYLRLRFAMAFIREIQNN